MLQRGDETCPCANAKKPMDSAISREAPNRGTFNDYPEREYTGVHACGSGRHPATGEDIVYSPAKAGPGRDGETQVQRNFGFRIKTGLTIAC